MAMKKKFWWMAAGAVAVLVLIGGAVARGRGAKPMAVQTSKVDRQKIVQKVNATGKIQPKTKVDISADVSGKIEKLAVVEGQWVEKGAFLVGLAFSAVGLIMCVLAKGWDFFSFYMTLVMTPMMMISGVFFPAEQLPAPLQLVAKALPLYHGVQIVRPLVAGGPPPDLWLHAGVLLAYAAAGYALAIHFARRRFSS